MNSPAPLYRFHPAPPALAIAPESRRDAAGSLPSTDVRPEKNPYETLRDQLRAELERSIYEAGGMRVKWLKVNYFVLAELDTAIGECVKEGVPQKQREARFAELLDVAENCDLGGARANTLYVSACRHKVLSRCAELDASARTPEQRQLESAVQSHLDKKQYLHALRTILIQPEYHRAVRVPVVVEKHLGRVEEESGRALQEAVDGRFSRARLCATKMCTATDRAVRAAKYGLYRAPALRPHDAALVERTFYTALEDTLSAVDLLRLAKKRGA